MYMLKPSLFVNTLVCKEGLLYRYKMDSSLEFLNCADEKLTSIFTIKTSLKPNKNLCFSLSTHGLNHPMLETGVISKLFIKLFVNHNWNPITILWKAKSGRIYKINDTDIDCDDIEFWFEKLDTELYIKQYYPTGQKLPFILKNLPFELVVTRLNLDCTLNLAVKNGYEKNRENIITDIYNFIEKFNIKSDKKDRADGLIHNSAGKPDGKRNIVFEIDLGSAGFNFFKKLLQYLSKVEGILRLEIA